MSVEATLAMLTIEPPPLASMPGSSARIVRYMARTLRSTLNEKASSSQSRIEPLWTKPAQLNSASGAG